jgi:hypothetical protein
MTAIWHNKDGKWGLLGPVGFQDEAALHSLVEESPELLPLAGSPRLAMLGREVRLGSGSADLLAIESTGRPVVIEIKLKANPEARRAVVAQVLAYAAFLYQMSFDELESSILAPHLQQRGFQTIADALANLTQSEVDASDLRAGVEGYLSNGSFRLVVVLDEVPPELVRLVGYLEAIGQGITVDLVSISAYQVGSDRVVVPQRVEPERLPTIAKESVPIKKQEPISVPGVGEFFNAIDGAPLEHQAHLRKLTAWADELANRGLATVGTTHGVRRKTLWVRVKGTDAGMVTIVTDYGGSVWLWPTVITRCAPEFLPPLEARFGSPLPAIRPDGIDDALLATLTSAYEAAALGRTKPSGQAN